MAAIRLQFIWLIVVLCVCPSRSSFFKRWIGKIFRPESGSGPASGPASGPSAAGTVGSSDTILESANPKLDAMQNAAEEAYENSGLEDLDPEERVKIQAELLMIMDTLQEMRTEKSPIQIRRDRVMEMSGQKKQRVMDPKTYIEKHRDRFNGKLAQEKAANAMKAAQLEATKGKAEEISWLEDRKRQYGLGKGKERKKKSHDDIEKDSAGDADSPAPARVNKPRKSNNLAYCLLGIPLFLYIIMKLVDRKARLKKNIHEPARGTSVDKGKKND